MQQLSYTLSEPVCGDYGWIIHRHGALYAQEGWNERFEAMVAQSLVNFIRIPDKSRTRGWVAKGAQGEVLGSIFITEESAEEAKLRLFYVEPSARGRGIGSALVQEAIAFSREKGFRRITLYTVSILHSALRIYAAAGFTLQSEAPTNEYGPELMTQIWALELAPAGETEAKAAVFNNC